MIRSASATSWFSSPLRSRPNISPTRSPPATLLRRKLGGRRRVDHGLRLIMRARGRGEHEIEVADRGLDTVVDLRGVEDAVRARRHHVGALGRPAFRAARPGAAATARNSPSRAPPRRYCRQAAARPGSRTAPAAPPISWSCRFRPRACCTSPLIHEAAIAAAGRPSNRVVMRRKRAFRAYRASAIARRLWAPPARPPISSHRYPHVSKEGLPQWRKSRLPIRSSRWTATR